MCQRDGRDAAGRFRPGTSGNPSGRRPDSPTVRLLRAVEDCGAEITIKVPPRRPRPSDLPPEAA